ncbi:elongation factor G [Patescibacteria group bacterium]|nr:elongation factor G [Patescibacteria group bacterium]
MPREHSIEKTRNIGIIAHIDAGKTTVTEGILYNTGLTHNIGAVHEGETVTDWMEQERERGITITAAAVTCYWKDHKINIIDTPGHVDFTVEVERSLRVLDGAVVVFDGKMGVEPQSETVWRQADKYHVPRICFINKINQTGGDFYKSLDSIHKRLSPNAFPIQLPIGFEKDINGIVDLVKMKSYTYGDFHDKQLVEGEIPADMVEKAKEYRHKLIEKIVESDDALMEKYLGGAELTEQEVIAGLRKAIVAGNMYAVLGGDGRGVIVQTILDAVVAFLPSPVDVPHITGVNPKVKEADVEAAEKIIRKPDDAEPFSALAFKIATDPFVGKLAFFRVYSGKLEAGSYVLNTRTGNKERVGRIVLMKANDRDDVKEVFAGDIAALVGPKETITGDTLCDVDHPVRLESIKFAEPVISMAIEPKTKADQEKMGIALSKLAEEDPTFHIKGDEETAQTIISGMGELHLEIIVDRMKREFKVEANVGKPQVAYKEKFKKIVESEGKYIRQSGGKGQYGHCWIRLEPREPGAGFTFESEIVGGTIPREFIAPIEKGVKEAAENGVIAGYPVIDFFCAVYDGSFHDVDSSEVAFKIAASKAFQEGVRKADPVLLEPIMKVEITVPDSYMGDVIGDVNAKRGQVKEMNDRGHLKIIDAYIPLAEMFGYATALRSMTQGQGNYAMEFDHYDEVPRNIAAGIIEARASVNARKGQ